MNSLAAPFTSLHVGNLSAGISGQRALLLVCLLVFAASGAKAQEGAAAAQAPATSPETRIGAPGTGTITGRVTSDDGRPLADAVIFLSRTFARVPGPPQTFTTDGEGRFRAPNLEAGLYTVGASLPGYAMSESLMEPGEPSYYKIGDSVNLTLVKGGVITGTVRDAGGEPVVAIPVRALRVRDARGRATPLRGPGSPERLTDDRGVYRIYGLPPGTYLVSSGGSQRGFGIFSAYEGDAPTFFPSSTRDTAVEVPVRGGEEAANIDIRYRGERGHAISGTVSGIVDSNARTGVAVTLRQAGSGGYEASSTVVPGTQSGFSFNGVSDGDYEVMAQQWGGGAVSSATSTPRPVKVKGADVTGVELVLAPLASIAGRITLEAAPKEKCGDGRGGSLLETMINARRDEKNLPENSSRAPFFNAGGGIPTDQGEFTVRNLMAGSYRLSLWLPSDAWYVRSIVLPGAAARAPTAPAKAAQPKSALPSLITLKTGENVTNVAVQISQDAAGLRGRVTAEAEGALLPPNLRVYLVPAERERTEDVLRYGEAQPGSDGVFTLKNLAPGRYWLIARPAPESESPERPARSLLWDADARAKLLREAEAANAAVELQPCQRINDYALRFAAAK
jgi:hypothetical protein